MTGTRWLLRGALLAGAAVLAAASGAHALANWSATRDPALAVRLAPSHAQALAAKADAALAAGAADPARRADAVNNARAALAIEPGNARALRVLAMAAQSGWTRDDASRLLALSHQASRRDLTAQLALLRQSAERKDLDGAVAHADIALRTVQQGQGIILPVLARTAVDPAIVPPLAKALAREPTWGEDYWRTLAEVPGAWGNAPALLGRLRAQGTALPQEPLALLILRMAYGGQPETAMRTMAVLTPGWKPVTEGIDQRRFAADRPVPPFDWDVASTGQLSVEPLKEGGLLVEAGRGPGGTAARRLLALRPGTYRLSATARIEGAGEGTSGRSGAATADPAMPAIRLRCAARVERAQSVAFEVDARRTAEAGTTPLALAATIGIDGACPHQWVELVLPSLEESGSITAVLERLTLARAGADR